MREIKFRARDFATAQWYIGSSHPRKGEINLGVFFCNVAVSSFDPNTLCEFTGLHDKNGKEIYEGDICKVVSISYSKRIGEVKFHRGCFIISFGEQADGYNSDMLYVPLKVELIGNIWENPKLLKEANEKEGSKLD